MPKFAAGFLDWVDDLFNKHQLVRRVVVFWGLYEVHKMNEVFYRVVLNMNEITIPVQLVMVAELALIGTITAFYIKSRELDNKV